jgi:hypothetical protein
VSKALRFGCLFLSLLDFWLRLIPGTLRLVLWSFPLSIARVHLLLYLMGSDFIEHLSLLELPMRLKWLIHLVWASSLQEASASFQMNFVASNQRLLLPNHLPLRVPRADHSEAELRKRARFGLIRWMYSEFILNLLVA